MSDDPIDELKKFIDGAFSRVDKFRMDGSPYPPGLDGLIEWGKDLEDTRGRIIQQEELWNGLWLSTVWLGLNHRYGEGPPLIFETMAFDHLGLCGSRGIWTDRWSTLSEAEAGHFWLKQRLGSVRFTLGLWWELIWSAIQDQEEEE